MTRRRLRLAGLTLLVAAGGLGWWLTRPSDLERTQAALDRSDPGWRLAQVWASRTADPPSGPHAVAVALTALPLPAEYTAWQTADFDADQARSVWWWPAGERWPADPQRVAAWRASAANITTARTAADRPPGVTLPAPSGDVFSSLLRHVQDARPVSNLLTLDAVESAGRGDVEGATASLRAVLSIGRGVAVEPFFPCALTRRVLARQAADALLRGLAAGEWPDADLAQLQTELAAEADPALAAAALRDERAVLDQQLTAVAGWQANVGSTLAVGGTTPRRLGLVGRTRYRLGVAEDHRAALADFTGLIAAAARPAHEWPAAVAAVPVPPDDDRHSLSRAAGLQARKLFVEQEVFHLAAMRATVAAVGCERYRLRHGRWPDALSDLPADLMPADGTDPYTGRPLVLRRLSDGVVVYGTGPDGQDDGGRLGPATRYDAKLQGDLGFRLWDMAARKPAEDKP